MEYNGSYQSDKRHPENGRGENAFAVIVIIVVIALLALLIAGLFWPSLLGGSTSADLTQITPTPSASASPAPDTTAGQEAQAPASPTPSPVVDENDRVMPNLDGTKPNVPGLVDNPIPDIYDAVSPGVVGVINYTKATSPSGKEYFEIYGSGTGFAVSSEGYILTNAHVVEGADKITVKVDGEDQERDALLIGSDNETDIAVLKVEGATLHPLMLGDSDTVRVGEYVLAIGNPLSTDELANTLTFGIISATTREITIDSYTNTYLQTDAAINFGNSGGPLINMDGLVIGINSAKTITAGYDELGNAVSAEGIGFALPINQVKKIMEILITEGKIDRPGIGITVSTISEEIAVENNVPVGAYVESVVKGQPSDQAGVLAGDIIVEANGKTIKTQDDLVSVIKSCLVGDELKIKVYRDGDYQDLTIIIGNKTDMNFDDIVGGVTPTPVPSLIPIP
ncbi:MAG TPA: trypsin-like peptidase domain-containing protein [Candidatus Cryosericum sp.]|nr:trypsin-like peptidase domain-containing protein [Candidatus Cryosericum sp.]